MDYRLQLVGCGLVLVDSSAGTTYWSLKDRELILDYVKEKGGKFHPETQITFPWTKEEREYD